MVNGFNLFYGFVLTATSTISLFLWPEDKIMFAVLFGGIVAIISAFIPEKETSSKNEEANYIR